VDLVALSACETAVGGGEDRNGREVEGLGVLVQRQGAKGVLASLWSVNDEATGQFMRLFYGYRQRKGMSKAEALRQAQLAFIENRVPAALAEVGRGRHTDASGKAVERATPKAISPSHPYYWAPFILMGNWL
jgi:CHAT domain-containing protein